MSPGTYTFIIGGSSQDVRLETKLVIEGDTVPLRDLTKMIQAINYDDYEGVYLDECKEEGYGVRLSGGSGWLRFDDVDFRAGNRRLRGPLFVSQERRQNRTQTGCSGRPASRNVSHS